MGIRIDAFAIDLSGFTKWIDRSVGDALFYIARHAVTDDVPVLTAYDRDTKYRYIPRPSGHVLQAGGGQRSELTETDAADISLLQQPLGTYLRSGSALDLKFLLGCLATCPQVSFVKVLTDGYRRWWIGSLLQGADDLGVFSHDEQAEFEDFFARMLGGWNCGYDLDQPKHGFGHEHFPFAPAGERDTGLAVMSAAECRRLVALLESLLAQNPNFSNPRKADFAGDETGWDEFVRSMVDALLPMRTFQFRDLRLLTFIG